MLVLTVLTSVHQGPETMVAWFISQKHSDQSVSPLELHANHMDAKKAQAYINTQNPQALSFAFILLLS